MNPHDPEQQAIYQRAADIADQLLAEGLPIIGFSATDHGHKAAFAILRSDGHPWGFRVPVDNLTVDAVRQLVHAYLD